MITSTHAKWVKKILYSVHHIFENTSSKSHLKKKKKLVSSLSPNVNASTIMQLIKSMFVVLAVNQANSEIEAFLTVTKSFVFI